MARFRTINQLQKSLPRGMYIVDKTNKIPGSERVLVLFAPNGNEIAWASDYKLGKCLEYLEENGRSFIEAYRQVIS